MSTSSGRHRKPHGTGEFPPVQAPGTEDVLFTHPGTDPSQDAPASHRTARHAVSPSARRSPWNRRGDRLAVVALVVVFALAATLVWTFSDSRATTQLTSGEPRDLPQAPTAVPAQLRESWQASSSATPEPVAEGGTVVTGDGGAVVGRDPLTGAQRWRYARELRLCTVGAEWDTALAVYRKDTGCSEVTQLDAGTGGRAGQRNGDAELGTRLVSDGSHVTTTGRRVLNTWRSDMVKSMEYGQVYGPKNADKQPRTGCTYNSVAAAASRVGVVERCPGDDADRLTVLEAVPENYEVPEEEFSQLLPGERGRLVAMTGEREAVVMPNERQLVVFDVDGEQRLTYPLDDLPSSDLRRNPPHELVTTEDSSRNVYWFTGSTTMALDADDLAPRWTMQNALGPGTMFADQYVVPIPGGLAVVDEETGKTLRTVGVDRHGYTGTVRLSAIGPVLLEQRGGTVVALR